MSHGHLVAHSRPHAHDDLGLDRPSRLEFPLSCILCVLLIARNLADDVGKTVLAWIVDPNGSNGGKQRCRVLCPAEVGLRVYAFTFGP